MARVILDSMVWLMRRKLANIRVVTPESDQTSALITACLQDNGLMAERELKTLDCLRDTETGSFVVSEDEEHGVLAKKTQRVRRVDGVIASMKNSMCGESIELGLLMKDKWLEVKWYQRDPELPVFLILVDTVEQDGLSGSATAESAWKAKLGVCENNVEIVSLRQANVGKAVRAFRAMCTKRMEEMDKRKG